MIASINDHRAVYGVEPICRVLPIAPSTYHAHAARRADPSKLPARARRDAALRAEIQRVFEANWFNTRRLRQPIGNIPPAEAEARYYAQADVQTLAA